MNAKIAAVLITCSVSILSAAGIRLVNGDRMVELSEADIDALPRHSITVDDHGKKVAFDGVLLSDVLKKVGAPQGDTLKGQAFAGHVRVRAMDDYEVAFSIAETDPDFSGRMIYLVTKRDGKPLSEKEGPFRLVVPDDKKANRWVRQVRTITVVK